MQRLARGLRELRGSHEELVALACHTAAFVEGPDDEGLTATAIARGEDARDVGHVLLVVGLDVGAGVAFEATLQVRNKLLNAYQDIMRMGG